MNTKLLSGWKWILTISSTVVLLGCLDQTSGTGSQAIANEVVAKTSTPAPDVQPDPTPVRAIIAPANLSPGIAEVVKLAESQVGEQVLLAYVEKSSRAFNPSIEEIVYLKDIGIPDSVLTAMVRQTNAATEVATTSAENKMAAQEPQISPTNQSAVAEPNYNEVAPVPPQQVNINYFENTLSPYGSWVDVADYGRCWQPTVVVVNHNWRPYGDRGRWVYTSCGWYWQSDYSWGWAPFHYGRWHCDNRIGWVWVPGCDWGPAWVSWRYTDDYCGWAPLPPTAHYASGFGFSYHNSHVGISFDFGLHDDCYTFIPNSRFCERSPSRYYVSGSHSKAIYKNSVVINNYVHGNNNTIINEGVGRERITKATKTPVRTVALRELPTTTNPIGRAERLEGNSLTVFRPNVTQSSTAPITRTASLSRTPIAPNSGLRSIPKPEPPAAKVPTTTQSESPAVSVAPSAPAHKTFTRTESSVNFGGSSPSRVQRQQTSVLPISPNPEPVPQKESAPPIVNARPSNHPSTMRNFPAQTSGQEKIKSIEHSPIAGAPVENSRSLRNLPSPVTQTPVARETQAAPNNIRSQPTTSQIQRSQQTPTETRRQESSGYNYGSAGRPSRSMTLPSTPSAPAPAQNLSAPPQNSRGGGRVERSGSQFIRPSQAAPDPSVRQSSPRAENAPGLLRNRVEQQAKGQERSERKKI